MAAKKKEKLVPVVIMGREDPVLLDAAAFKKKRVRQLSVSRCDRCGSYDDDLKLVYDTPTTVYCAKCGAAYKVEWMPEVEAPPEHGAW